MYRKGSKRKRNKAPKTGPVFSMSSVEATLAGKPLYNGYACGHGAHGDDKYNRAKAKREAEREMSDE